MTEQDDRIEALLRTRRIQPTPDGGFSTRVMAHLPRRRRLAHRWIVPALSVFGALLAALIVPRAQLSPALAAVAEPQTFLILALAVAVTVWIASVWVLIDRRYRAL